MAARRPFWKWHRWKSIGSCLWPPSTCIWNLKLKFQSKLDLCSGNHVVYRQTDGRTDGQTDRRTRWIQYTPPPTSLGGGIINYVRLTYCGRVTHICVSNLIIIGSDNGLSPGRRQAIIWTNAGLLIGPFGTNFNYILIEILTFSFKKMRLKVLPVKWRPLYCGLNVLKGLTVIAGATDTPCHVVKSLGLIQRPGTTRYHLRVPDLPMSCSDWTCRQGTRIVVPIIATRMTCPVRTNYIKDHKPFIATSTVPGRLHASHNLAQIILQLCKSMMETTGVGFSN